MSIQRKNSINNFLYNNTVHTRRFYLYFAIVKKLLAYLFIIVFLFSIVPVKELGKLLGKGQTTEEVHSDDCPGGDDIAGKVKKEMDPFTEMTFQTVSDVLFVYNSKMQVAIHGSSVLPDHFVASIPTPPPNFC